MPDRLDFDVDCKAIQSGFDGETCWVHARGGFIPRADRPATAIITTQKLLLSGSDIFYALHVLRSDDGGQSWQGPTEQPHFARFPGPNGSEGVICDFTPHWHQPSGKLLGTGHTALYRDNKVIAKGRQRQPVYSVFNDQTNAFDPWHAIELPQPAFFNAGSGSTQRVDLPDGDVLLPIYARSLEDEQAGAPYNSCVLRCGFDGRRMTVRQIGEPVRLAVARGLYEPSLACCAGRYYLTLRNDLHGYVAVSDDGLHFSEPKAWTFDDGSELGNYNTQQHWATHQDGLFLVYTRRGLDNDHVFRHRAPLLIAQVDPDRLCVIRDTERVAVPQRGARLGNFAVANYSAQETWITVTEWMQPRGCEKYGSDNTIWLSRIRWHKPNA